MNLLAGDLTPTEGEQRRSHKLRVGRYAQHFVDALRMDETPVDYLLSRYPESGAWVAAGLCGFGDGGSAEWLVCFG
jgi:ATPase subunit of ABC transporter with duplicated ATPase domains